MILRNRPKSRCRDIPSYFPIFTLLRILFTMFPTDLFSRDVTNSTMEDARDALRSGSGHGTVCTALTQNNGRGRVAGRRWEDDGSGSLLFTLILHRDSVNTAYPLTQLLALALCRRMEKGFNITPQIKWPNDVLVTGMKIAGILVETEGDFYLAGMGVNLLQTSFPSILRHSAISLSQAVLQDGGNSSVALPPSEELPHLLSEIEILLAVNPEIGEIEKRLAGLQQQVSVKLGDPSRNNILSGTLFGLQGDGALLIDSGESELRAVYSGEIDKNPHE